MVRGEAMWVRGHADLHVMQSSECSLPVAGLGVHKDQPVWNDSTGARDCQTSLIRLSTCTAGQAAALVEQQPITSILNVYIGRAMVSLLLDLLPKSAEVLLPWSDKRSCCCFDTFTCRQACLSAGLSPAADAGHEPSTGTAPQKHSSSPRI